MHRYLIDSGETNDILSSEQVLRADYIYIVSSQTSSD